MARLERIWNTPILKEPVIQANANVALLQLAEESTFDYWLRLSTLEKGHPVFLPVKLAAHHRQALAGKTFNTSMVLARKADGWWLTLSYDEQVKVETPTDAPVIGVDVGIANFLTASTGQHDGTFTGTLAERHKRDREKRRRKAKLRACLKKKGVTRLPSTRTLHAHPPRAHTRSWRGRCDKRLTVPSMDSTAITLMPSLSTSS